MSTEAGGPAAPELQFDKAQFAGAPATRTCQRCQRTITHEYFDAGGQAVCHDCSQELSGARGGGPAFLRALVWGGGAALLGTFVWFAVIKLFEAELGLIAIVVGLAVGYGVRKGSGGRGGWEYQALAMGLTYVSITASYVFLGVPFAIALVSPFLGGAENIMGLIIIAIALYEAWKLNKKVPITGPFRLAPAEPLAQPVAGVG